MKFLKKIQSLNNVLNNNPRQVSNNEDIYSLQLLNNVLESGNFIPITSMSLRPFVLAFLLNEITINKREHIIEFGAGISTILLARLYKMNNFSGTIVSVEENLSWFRIIEKALREEGLLDFVKIIHCPLEEKIFMGSVNHWYKHDVLKEALIPFSHFDMVIIDGPTAFNEQIELSRYFAMPFLNESLLKEHVILLDDANRKGEMNVMQMWKKEYGMHFTVYAETLGVYYQGSHFESNPVKSVNITQV